MRAVLRGNPAGRCRVRGAVPVVWRSVPELCPAGLANRQANQYSDTAPGSWLTTLHEKARDNAGVLTFSAARLHIGAPVGLAFRGCGLPAARRRGGVALSMACWCSGSAVGLTCGRCAEGSPAAGLGCAMPEALWATQRSSATQRTAMVTDWCSWLVTATRSQCSAVQNPHRDISTLIGCLRGTPWLHAPGRGQGSGLPDRISRHDLGLGSVRAILWPRETRPDLSQSPLAPRAGTLCLGAAKHARPQIFGGLGREAFGGGLTAVPGGRVRASLGHGPHQWYPRFVYL